MSKSPLITDNSSPNILVDNSQDYNYNRDVLFNVDNLDVIALLLTKAIQRRNQQKESA